MDIFYAHNLSEVAPTRPPLCPSLEPVLVRFQSATTDWPQFEWIRHSLRQYNMDLRVESMSAKLGSLIHLIWGPEDGQLWFLTHPRRQPDASLFALYHLSFYHMPWAPLVRKTRISAFDLPPAWPRFHIWGWWTMPVAADGIRLPLPFLPQSQAECYHVGGYLSKYLIGDLELRTGRVLAARCFGRKRDRGGHARDGACGKVGRRRGTLGCLDAVASDNFACGCSQRCNLRVPGRLLV